MTISQAPNCKPIYNKEECSNSNGDTVDTNMNDDDTSSTVSLYSFTSAEAICSQLTLHQIDLSRPPTEISLNFNQVHTQETSNNSKPFSTGKISGPRETNIRTKIDARYKPNILRRITQRYIRLPSHFAVQYALQCVKSPSKPTQDYVYSSVFDALSCVPLVVPSFVYPKLRIGTMMLQRNNLTYSVVF